MAPCTEDPQWPSSRSEVAHIIACDGSFVLLNPSDTHTHRLTLEPAVINGPSVMLSSSSPSCPSCLPPLTTGFICFLSVPRHNHSISFSSGRWGTQRGTHCPLSSSLGLTLEWKRERVWEIVCVTGWETVKYDMEGRKERLYPCLSLNLYIYWTINKPG